MPSTRPNSPILLAVIVAGVMVAVSGCGAIKQPAEDTAILNRSFSPSSQTSAAAPTSTSPVKDSDAVRAALDAYRGMWHQLTIAAASSNHQVNGLASHATGQALTTLRGMLYNDSIAGLVTLGQPTLSPKVAAVRIPEVPIEADIVDCVDTTTWRKYKARGGVAENRPAGRRHTSAVVRNTDGEWKVTKVTIDDVSSC
ncbi:MULTISPECIES: hypothetical protein [unclassified Crossiella]|uniref:hypothetical protein n=1 Tax=unclassified Crossiella TaxID=2620835 RepID=UPI001FFFC085|nr:MULTISPECIES: hypothetical protein [unclassified Crossiella]MCK2243701.1 hypothetical protein [Crossiella sp. S99.2]MCK2257560.1 hypothetical protein [Crossiella sp. S99.1]